MVRNETGNEGSGWDRRRDSMGSDGTELDWVGEDRTDKNRTRPDTAGLGRIEMMVRGSMKMYRTGFNSKGRDGMRRSVMKRNGT